MSWCGGIAEGRWAQLLHECVAAARKPTAASTASAADGSDYNVRRRAERAAALAYMGELSAAAQLGLVTHGFPMGTPQPRRSPRRCIEPPLNTRSLPIMHRTLPTGVAGQSPPSLTGANSRGRRVAQRSTCGSCWTRSSAPSVADAPGKIAGALRIGRVVTLTKPTGGTRAPVMGDVFRRLVARMLPQQLGKQFRQACVPSARALGLRPARSKNSY